MNKPAVLTFSIAILAMGFGITAASAAQSRYANGDQYYHWANEADQYQRPNGLYASQTDFIRSLNGTPCGIECERRELGRWSGQH